MYYEDSEFCRRVREATSSKVYFYPYATIVHFGGMSADIENFATLIECFKSARNYLRTFYGNRIARVWVFLCRFFWAFEILIFWLLRFSPRANKKMVMLGCLLKYDHEN